MFQELGTGSPSSMINSTEPGRVTLETIKGPSQGLSGLCRPKVFWIHLRTKSMT